MKSGQRFRPRRKRLHEQVAEHLWQRIGDSDPRPGDGIPSERERAERTGVCRAPCQRSRQSASSPPTRIRAGPSPVPLVRPAANILGEYARNPAQLSPSSISPLAHRLLTVLAVCYAQPEMPSPEHPSPPDIELSRPALILAQHFVQRWDLHGRQLDNGSYICVHESLNVALLFRHLRGEVTLGTYLLDQEGRARFIVLDADDDRQ